MGETGEAVEARPKHWFNSWHCKLSSWAEHGQGIREGESRENACSLQCQTACCFKEKLESRTEECCVDRRGNEAFPRVGL